MTLLLANGTKMSLIARETAPAAAYKDMFHGDSNLAQFGEFLGPEGKVPPLQDPWPPVFLVSLPVPGS